jgi:hypothetical protein
LWWRTIHHQVDEHAVLKHFDWPEKRADALRDAAARYQGLLQLEKQMSSFFDDRALHRDVALDKMFSLFEKCVFSSGLVGAEFDASTDQAGSSVSLQNREERVQVHAGTRCC